MQKADRTHKKSLLTGWVLTAFSALFLLVDGVFKLIKPAPVLESALELGYPESVITVIGIILIMCTILYLIPRFSFIGAVLLTGYLGGAIATHLRIENPLFTHVLFPVYIGILVWAGLYFRNQQVKNFFATRSK